MVHSNTQRCRRNTNNAKQRHAAPSAPWPWIDIDDHVELYSEAKEPWTCPHPPGYCVDCWKLYPQSLFPNWTKEQVDRSGMKTRAISTGNCIMHRIDVKDNGDFSDPGYRVVQQNEEFWQVLQRNRRGKDVRLRALFVENLTEPVLQMLGTWYNVEPFFWTSSINWIPSRYQENICLREGDHITVTLSFPRAHQWDGLSKLKRTDTVEEIDTQSPLPIQFTSPEHGVLANHSLILDLLSVHLIRNVRTSTIISYQPPPYKGSPSTSASSLHSRVYLAGKSVYWKKLFTASKDPTFVLLTILWYALYAWDHSLELLWEHISHLEMNVINSNNIKFTHELHKIRAYLLHYVSLLKDFKKTVKFVEASPNPAMDAPERASERALSRQLLKKECDHLLAHIDRLCSSQMFWDKRLTNIMHLAFSNVNIDDSKHMKKLTEASVRDSAAMKQVSYLAMVFLPASFVAAVFGMNIKEMDSNTNGTLLHYVAATLPLTLVTIWIIIALQGRWVDEKGDHLGVMSRLSWPMLYIRQWVPSVGREMKKNEK